MNKYWVDFQGYVSIEANNKIEAEERFWEEVQNLKLNYWITHSWQIDGIERMEQI